MALALLWIAAALTGAAARCQVQGATFFNITVSDGTVLNADVTLPTPTSANELFPVIIFVNSWAVPQFEYIVQAQDFASQGYVVLEYEARGWYNSGGLIDTAGPKDQGDISDVIDYVLRQSAWQPDPSNIAMCGISYGAGLSLLGASVDSRVKTVVAMSGWQTLERALFEESTPNKVWGDILVKLANWLGHPEPTLQYMFDQVLAGNESAFKEFAAVRSPALYQAQLEARQVPIFFSNNMEDRLFHPQDTLDFFNSYSGPKRLLLNQGIHATAEIGGLVNFPGNHVWIEAKIWIAHYLKGAPASWPMVEMKVRDNDDRLEFATWPTDRITMETLRVGPRGSGWYGSLGSSSSGSPAFETISFVKSTGIDAGIPVLGQLLQLYVDTPITSNLLLSSEKGAIWYHQALWKETRFCGTPKISIDITSSHDQWQVVAYLFGVDGLTKIGTLLSHGVATCWNCTAGVRQTRTFELRTMCKDVGYPTMSGLGLALNLYSDLYQPANSADDFSVMLHYSDDFYLEMPVVDSTARAVV